MITTKKLIMAMAIGALGGAIIFNALKPHNKTVDDYVNCFRNVEVKAMPLKESEDLYDFVVVFDKYKITQEKSKEFFDKVGYNPLRSTLTDKYLVFEIDSSKIRNPASLSQKLHECFLNSIHSTSWSFK
ncbi:hypothetical protein HYX19_01065 [Candidatus Woesearchaeota archaeon]|nr:hypothetical protein [Candidatus Woesearchaeota archaeon]